VKKHIIIRSDLIWFVTGGNKIEECVDVQVIHPVNYPGQSPSRYLALGSSVPLAPNLQIPCLCANLSSLSRVRNHLVIYLAPTTFQNKTSLNNWYHTSSGGLAECASTCVAKFLLILTCQAAFDGPNPDCLISDDLGLAFCSLVALSYDCTIWNSVYQ
jgi:hypothetical protein